MRRKNIIAAVTLIAFALVYGFLTANLPVRALPDTPGTSFFPWINTIVLLVLSAWLLMRGLRQPPDEPLVDEGGRRRSAAWALGAFVAYLAVLPGLGFILATAPFFAIMMMLFGERRPIWISTGAICATGILYVLFRHGFGVFLPRGILAGIVA